MGDTNFIESSTPMVNSVLHATKILDYYASQRREYLSLTEISRAIGLHKTTVYRILRTLQSVGWIEQSSTNGQYRLGSGILMIASAVSVHYTTRQLISEEMRRLCDLHNETVVLSSLRGDTGICVDLVKGHHNLGISSENGYIVPLDCGATGKTLLAAQSDELVERLIQNYPGLEEKLRNQVKEIRQRGYCISEGEVDEGVAAVAVPLPMPDHIYTLTYSGPVERLRGLDYMVLVHSLQQAVKNILLKCDGKRKIILFPYRNHPQIAASFYMDLIDIFAGYAFFFCILMGVAADVSFSRTGTIV